MAMQRGLDAQHEQNALHLIRDTRSWTQRFSDYLKSPTAVSITLFAAAASCLIPVISTVSDITLILGIILFVAAINQKTTLPFRLPKRSKLDDYGNPLPGSGKPRKADGIYFFGNEKKTGLELWFANEDMRTHALFFGSTGSGKTEALLSVSYNALIHGSGFIYVDGKGDNSIFAKVFSMCRFMGREDDLLLINFMTGAKDIVGPQEKRLSNTLNPFATGSSSMLSQLVVSLMDSSSQSSDGDMWKGRAIAFVEALMKVLVAMRDAGHILLDANSIRNYFHLSRLEAMVVDKAFIRDGGLEPISLEGLPDVVLEPINNYLFNLPGYNKEKKGKQVSQVLEQHGFITMQLVRVFSSLADTYGHILRTKLAEVDLKDVVLNRRILLVLLPALEKSPAELSNLGKIIIATLKVMMASGLGEAVEGTYQELVQRKPTNARTPFLCVLDEYGYYAVEGFAVVPAQARSLGFSVIFAGQDLPAFQKASKEEAASIGANTNIKVCMKLEDPIETWEFFSKTAGESYVTHTSGFQSDLRSMSNAYRDTQGAQLEKRARIDLLDLKEQGVGEGHIFFKSKIVRANFFYADPKPPKEMRLNQFIQVDTPPELLLQELSEGFKGLGRLKAGVKPFEEVSFEGTDVQFLADQIKGAKAQKPAIEKGVSALMAYHKKAQEEGGSSVVAFEEELSEKELNIFTPLRVTPYLKSTLCVKELENFKKQILNWDKTKQVLNFIEGLSGKSKQVSQNLSNDLMKDIETATYYPPKAIPESNPEDLVKVINLVIKSILLHRRIMRK
jgi:intracellular multiplication protein IcmO